MEITIYALVELYGITENILWPIERENILWPIERELGRMAVPQGVETKIG